jgi:hypothetical protein
MEHIARRLFIAESAKPIANSSWWAPSDHTHALRIHWAMTGFRQEKPRVEIADHSAQWQKPD